MLVVDPKKRITAVQVLEHTWIQGNVGDADLTEILKELKKTRENESKVRFSRSTQRKIIGYTTSSGSIARLAIDSI